MSVPNQYIVKINKHPYEKNFLQIGIDEWMEASKVLSKAEFQFYLYLAGNRNGYPLELSRKYVMEKLDICETTYKKLVGSLKKAGYLIETSPNHLSFYTTPQKSNGVEKCPNTNGVEKCPIDSTVVYKNAPSVGYKNAPLVGYKNAPEIDKIDNEQIELNITSSLTPTGTGRCNIPLSINQEGEQRIDGEIDQATADAILEKTYITPSIILTSTGKYFKVKEMPNE